MPTVNCGFDPFSFEACMHMFLLAWHSLSVSELLYLGELRNCVEEGSHTVSALSYNVLYCRFRWFVLFKISGFLLRLLYWSFIYAVTSYRDTLWPFLGLELEGWNGGSVSTFKLLAAISLNNICPLYFVTSRLHIGSTASAPTRCKKGKNAELTSNSEVSPGKQRETFTWDNVFFIAKYCGNC